MIKKALKTMHYPWPGIKNVYGLILLFCCTTVIAQVNPSEKKEPAVFSPIRPTDGTKDIREKLVQLALQNPTYEIEDSKVSIAEYQVRKSKTSWLAPIVATANINEFAFKSTTVINGVAYNPSALYPKYNLGVNIPFNLFSEKKNDVKIAKETLFIAQAEKNQRFREIKAEVLTKYEDYLMWQQKLEFQIQVTQDAKTAYQSAEKGFQEGSVKQEEYNKSYRGYIDESEKQLEYHRNFIVTKLELEKLIGVSMEDVLKR